MPVNQYEKAEIEIVTHKKDAPETIGRVSVEYLLSSRQDEVATLDGDAFKIGTRSKCEIRFDAETDADVMGYHGTLIYTNGKWYIAPEPDCKIWINDQEVKKYVEVPNGAMLFFGKPMGAGIRVFGQTEVKISRRTLAMLLERGGRQGRMVSAAAARVTEEMNRQQEWYHRALERIQRRETTRYRWAFAGLVIVSIIGMGAVYYQSQKIDDLREIAGNIFFQMKEIEVHIAEQELDSLDTSTSQAQLAQLSKSYDRYLEELDVMSGRKDYEDKLILRMARAFGESELTMPEEFAATVKSYIKKWQVTNRYSNAIERSEQKEYIDHIIQAMLEQNIPPHFYYIALQESDFDTSKCGPRTRFGIAKGMWQFMPPTALQYGLKLGPLVKARVADPRDERHHFQKATTAASRYLKTIYTTEAQASGLLVLASYNYGENRVRQLTRQLGKNPRERNFWNLMTTFDIPKQTKDYVFYIFSAAVIGEDPEYFGFDMENPISDIIDKYAARMAKRLGP